MFTPKQFSKDDSWALCVISFSLNFDAVEGRLLQPTKIKLTNGTLFGIGPESEDLSPFQSILRSRIDNELSGEFTYKILEVCILEVFDYNCKFCKITFFCHLAL